MQVQEITTEQTFSSILSTLSPSTLAVVYFHAPWAAPCKQMSAVLSALASTYPADTASSPTFLSIDAEELPSAAEQFEVAAVPFVVLYKAGQTVETVSGTDAKKVRDAVEKHAGVAAVAVANSGGGTLPPVQKVSRPVEGQEATPVPTTTPIQNGNGTASAAKDLSAYAAPSSATEAPVDKEALFTRLGNLVKAAPVMLFMKGTPSAPKCGFSRQTVGLLRDRGVRYGFFNILADDDVRQGLKEFSDWPTFPQLYVDGELIGGLDIVSL
jgi:Grx4 family monothiol glutaredoxin